ncbi:hypothetical protein ACQJBY_019228 [Aegilops geniculata]
MLPPACDNSSTGQPVRSVEEGENLKEMRRENSETCMSNFKSKLSMVANCEQAMRTANMQNPDVRVQTVVELFKKVYQDLPPGLQEKLRADLNPGIFKHAQEKYGLPKLQGTTTKKLGSWTVDSIVLPVVLGFLMFIISLYFY